MLGYYDIVLGLIPAALLGLTGTLTFAGVALTSAVPIAALVAVALIGHAMFVNGPVDATTTTPATGHAHSSGAAVNAD